MKKIIILASLALLLTLAACSAGNLANDEMPATAPDGAWSPPTTTEPAMPASPALPSVETDMVADSELSLEDNFRFNMLDRETHLQMTENEWRFPGTEAAISFTLQMDTASYRNVARMINNGRRPNPDAVRIAEMINYFNFDYVSPLVPGSPFSVYAEIGPSPFNSNSHLAFVRVRAQDIDRAELPPSNLTFLIDTSGSMASANRLPLVQQSLALLVENLDENDTISVVTYAGYTQVLLDSVPGNQHCVIMDAINGLRAAGSTAGGPGISRAYELTMQNFDPSKNNRIILATDGDFNVGVSTVAELTDMMSEYRQRGIYMTILGFGMGNFRDDMLEAIARNGNANYHYIDTIQAAYKVFVEELISNMFVIAEDVRTQIQFNPAFVENYRLIGYENRIIDNIDFDNDFRDAGEIGVGSEVVLMFELTLINTAPRSESIFDVLVRYHNPGEYVSNLITVPVGFDRILIQNSSDFNFAAAVAAFGHVLRGSEHTGNATYMWALDTARANLGQDRGGHRRTFVELIETYRTIH